MDDVTPRHSHTRAFQVIVWGATGFTGRLVCEHIASDYQGTVTWALAGRNKAKLEAVRASLTTINASCKVAAARRLMDARDVPIFVGSLHESKSLDKFTGQTQVLLSLAGPFAVFGEAVWVKHMVQKYHSDAVAKGVNIVHCCAYDSVPADLGTLLVVEHMRQVHGRMTSKVQCIVNHITGGASGGSIASSLAMAMEPASELRKAAESVYYLCSSTTGTERPGTDVPDHWWIGYNHTLSCYTEPFLLQFCDRRVVHRSNALLGNSYGDRFCFEEARQAHSLLAAVCGACFTVAIKWVMLSKRLHAILQRILPQPGTGPALESIKNGCWQHTIIGYSQEDEPSVQPKVSQRLQQDANSCLRYSISAIMSGVSAGQMPCTANRPTRSRLTVNSVNESQDGHLAGDGRCEGGVLTPAAAMGMALVRRLQNAGFTFEVS